MGPQFCDSSNSSSKIEGEDDRLGARFSVGTLQFWCLEMLSVSKLKEQLGTCTCQDEVVVTKTARASLTQNLV